MAEKSYKEVVFDIETDGLLDSLTKLHVLSAMMPDGEIVSTTDHDTIRDIFSMPDTLFVGHHIIQFDLPALRKLSIVDLCPVNKVVDTLPLSWTLYPDRGRHGLAQWGEDLGVAKPEVEDWEGLTYEEYAHRCSEDVKINKLLWGKLKNKLEALYG
jgi:DNA polymerase III alpha subunit (gram-positive type)